MELTQSIASMRSASSLDHPSELSVDDCKALLADLGFLHVPGEPFGAGRAYLLVALRPLPTRAHFDPERIELWTLENGRSQPSEISRIARPATSTFEWGTIRIVDRIPVVNQFVAFGGDLAIANSNGVRTVVLTSDAPILSLGGHSGGADPLAASIGGFFAKLRAAAGSISNLRQRADDAEPLAIYAAYLQFALDRCSSGIAAEIAPAKLVTVLRSERNRVRSTSPLAAFDGVDLARELDDF